MPPPGAFAVYRAFSNDPFPNAPPPSFTHDGPRPWIWGYGGTPAGLDIHYVILFGHPSDSPQELMTRAHAPAATLPPDAHFVFYGKEWTRSHGHIPWVFETVAVSDPPELDTRDIESCEIEDGKECDWSSGVEHCSLRPWLKLHFNDAGKKKLAAQYTGLVVAFGDSAMSLVWLPKLTLSPSFLIGGTTDEMRYARARTLVAACSAPAKT